MSICFLSFNIEKLPNTYHLNLWNVCKSVTMCRVWQLYRKPGKVHVSPHITNERRKSTMQVMEHWQGKKKRHANKIAIYSCKLARSAWDATIFFVFSNFWPGINFRDNQGNQSETSSYKELLSVKYYHNSGLPICRPPRWKKIQCLIFF